MLEYSNDARLQAASLSKADRLPTGLGTSRGHRILLPKAQLCLRRNTISELPFLKVKEDDAPIPLSLGLWECDCPRACLHSGVSDYKEHLSGNENSKGKTYKSVTEGTASCRSSGSVVWFRANNCSDLAL